MSCVNWNHWQGCAKEQVVAPQKDEWAGCNWDEEKPQCWQPAEQKSWCDFEPAEEAEQKSWCDSEPAEEAEESEDEGCNWEEPKKEENCWAVQKPSWNQASCDLKYDGAYKACPEGFYDASQHSCYNTCDRQVECKAGARDGKSTGYCLQWGGHVNNNCAAKQPEPECYKQKWCW